MLVGYIARVHGYNDITHSYYYRVQGVTTPQLYSITLTNAAFLHRKYLDEYTKNLPIEAKEFVNRNINCEDMFMVAMINEFMKKNYQSQCVCLWVDEVAANLENGQSLPYSGLFTWVIYSRMDMFWIFTDIKIHESMDLP